MQNMIDIVLKDCTECCHAYLHDLVVFSQTWDDHLDQLKSIFTILKEAGLTHYVNVGLDKEKSTT